MKTKVKWYAVLDEERNTKFLNNIIKHKKELVCEQDAEYIKQTHTWKFYWKENSKDESGELPCKLVKETIITEEFYY